MQNELTPKQQVTELIRQANNILLVTGREPNTDQLSSVVAMQTVLTRLGKQAEVIISDQLPKSAELFHTDIISRDLTGIRDFIIKLRMGKTEVEKLKYQVSDDSLDIIITPHNGNFSAKDATFDYGSFQFDLVIAMGVPQINKLDKILEQNPTIFDGLHLLNIDYHRINENYGSVNLVDTAASSTAEMLISVFESLGQGMVDEYVATAILAGIMSATSNFTAPSTTAKAMTMAAQMVAAGGKQQEVVRVLKGGKARSDNRDNNDKSGSNKSVQEAKPTDMNAKGETKPFANPHADPQPETKDIPSDKPLKQPKTEAAPEVPAAQPSGEAKTTSVEQKPEPAKVQEQQNGSANPQVDEHNAPIAISPLA
ncbi:DHH family phosphoesterase [Candidatus Saccharibacteria bacterium]|nr:DHH family phosphoesterase [Candidatus Saccharibacteria bacterium]